MDIDVYWQRLLSYWRNSVLKAVRGESMAFLNVSIRGEKGAKFVFYTSKL